MNPKYLEQLVNHRVSFVLVGNNLGPVVVTAVTTDGYVEYTTAVIYGQTRDGMQLTWPGIGKVMASALIGAIDLGEVRAQ